MEERGQPDSPDPDDPMDNPFAIPRATEPGREKPSTVPETSARTTSDSNCSSNIDVGASNSFGPPLNLPLPILPASLQGLELTPGVTAALRRMLDEKNKKDALVTRMKTLMDWDAVGEEVRLLFPDDFLSALAEWIINHNQPEVIKQCILDQNRKETEFHKKRDDLLADQQKELNVLRKHQAEVLNDCDAKNTPHRKPIVVKQNEEELAKVLARQKEDIFSLDRKIVAAIDQLLTAQQRRFNEVGIPGMKESMESTDILQQMVVVDVIAKLAGIGVVVAPAL